MVGGGRQLILCPPEAGEHGGGTGGPLDVLVFEVTGQRYGIAVTDVVEVVRAVAPVPLPQAPAIIEGIINVRGRVVPVLDLRARFGLPGKATGLTDHLIVARAGPRVVAVRAERAVGLVTLDADEIEEAPGFSATGRHVAGVAILPDGLVIIHDLDTFLSETEAEQMDQALEDARSRGGA